MGAYFINYTRVCAREIAGYISMRGEGKAD